MELYVKMTDEELEEFKNYKNNTNPNLVDLRELSVTQLLNLKLKKVSSSGIQTNPKSNLREIRTLYEDEIKSVEVVLTVREVF